MRAAKPAFTPSLAPPGARATSSSTRRSSLHPRAKCVGALRNSTGGALATPGDHLSVFKIDGVPVRSSSPRRTVSELRGAGARRGTVIFYVSRIRPAASINKSLLAGDSGPRRRNTVFIRQSQRAGRRGPERFAGFAGSSRRLATSCMRPDFDEDVVSATSTCAKPRGTMPRTP